MIFYWRKYSCKRKDTKFHKVLHKVHQVSPLKRRTVKSSGVEIRHKVSQSIGTKYTKSASSSKV